MYATPNGYIAEVEYDEPVQNADGSSLTDLDHTSIYVTLGAGREYEIQVPASSPGGGGHIVVQVPLSILPGMSTILTVDATATSQGGASPHTNAVTLLVDRTSEQPYNTTGSVAVATSGARV